jgi:hypothetical protein
MTDLVAAIITRLKANTTICSSTYVGATPNQRIYRSTFTARPTLPLIVVHRVDGVRENAITRGVRYANARIQCTAMASTDVAADALSELIADDLNGLTNTILSTGANAGVYVVSVEDAGVVPMADPVMGTYLYHRDFTVVYDPR